MVAHNFKMEATEEELSGYKLIALNTTVTLKLMEETHSKEFMMVAGAREALFSLVPITCKVMENYKSQVEAIKVPLILEEEVQAVE